MSADIKHRPRQVRTAAALIIAGSVFLVISAFEQMSSLRSLENRESIEEALAEPPGSGLGLSVPEALDLLSVLVSVAAACAVASAILGYYALQGSRSARLGLSVLAPPLFVAGVAVGGFLSALVAVGVVMLWLQPARDWYAGRPPARPVEQPPAPRTPGGGQGSAEAPPSGPAPTLPGPGADGPPPYTGYAAAPVSPPARPGHGTPPAPSSAHRPAAVVWACALTWAGATLVGLGMLVSGVLLARQPQQLIDQLEAQDPELAAQVTEDLLLLTVLVMVGVVVLWCVAAAVLAWFAFRGKPWGRVALLSSAAVAAVVSLAGVALGSVPLLLPLAAALVTVALLSRPEARAWFAGRGSISA